MWVTTSYIGQERDAIHEGSRRIEERKRGHAYDDAKRRRATCCWTRTWSARSHARKANTNGAAFLYSYACNTCALQAYVFNRLGDGRYYVCYH